jgi:hypothetical protein
MPCNNSIGGTIRLPALEMSLDPILERRFCPEKKKRVSPILDTFLLEKMSRWADNSSLLVIPVFCRLLFTRLRWLIYCSSRTVD